MVAAAYALRQGQSQCKAAAQRTAAETMLSDWLITRPCNNWLLQPTTQKGFQAWVWTFVQREHWTKIGVIILRTCAAVMGEGGFVPRVLKIKLINNNPRHTNAASALEVEKEQERPMQAVKFYLKANSVVTIDDGFMRSSQGAAWLTGSFPLFNY